MRRTRVEWVPSVCRLVDIDGKSGMCAIRGGHSTRMRRWERSGPGSNRTRGMAAWC